MFEETSQPSIASLLDTCREYLKVNNLYATLTTLQAVRDNNSEITEVDAYWTDFRPLEDAFYKQLEGQFERNMTEYQLTDAQCCVNWFLQKDSTHRFALELQVKIYIKQKQYNTALTMLDHLMAIEDQFVPNPNFVQLKCEIYALCEEYELEKQELRHLISLYGRDTQVTNLQETLVYRLRLCQLYMRNQAFDQVLFELNYILSVDEENLDALELRHRVYIERGDATNAAIDAWEILQIKVHQGKDILSLQELCKLTILKNAIAVRRYLATIPEMDAWALLKLDHAFERNNITRSTLQAIYSTGTHTFFDEIDKHRSSKDSLQSDEEVSLESKEL